MGSSRAQVVATILRLALAGNSPRRLRQPANGNRQRQPHQPLAQQRLVIQQVGVANAGGRIDIQLPHHRRHRQHDKDRRALTLDRLLFTGEVGQAKAESGKEFIVFSAAIANGLKVVGKKLEDVKVVASGAGAAALACLNLLVALGLKRENVWIADVAGVVYKGRKELMDPYKEPFAQETNARTMAEIFPGASYTDLNAVLPSKLILMAIAIICAIAFFAVIVLRDLRIPAEAGFDGLPHLLGVGYHDAACFTGDAHAPLKAVA